MRYWIATMAMALTLQAAHGQTQAMPAPAVIQHNREVIAHTADADSVFQVQNDGSIRHLQSGMVCPAAWPNLMFESVMILPIPVLAKGESVSCNYSRVEAGIGMHAKLSIAAMRVPGLVLDKLFTDIRNVFVQDMPNAMPLGEAMGNIGTRPGLPDGTLSEEVALTLRDRPFAAQLFVATHGDWSLQVRMIFEDQPIAIPQDARNTTGATLREKDRNTGFEAMRLADATIGTAP